MLGCRRPDESATPRLSAGRALADGVLRPFFRTMGMVDSSRGVPPKGGLNELQMDTQQGLSSPPAPPRKRPSRCLLSHFQHDILRFRGP